MSKAHTPVSINIYVDTEGGKQLAYVVLLPSDNLTPKACDAFVTDTAESFGLHLRALLEQCAIWPKVAP